LEGNTHKQLQQTIATNEREKRACVLPRHTHRDPLGRDALGDDDNPALQQPGQHHLRRGLAVLLADADEAALVESQLIVLSR
jgi:hypothetical protein